MRGGIGAERGEEWRDYHPTPYFMDDDFITSLSWTEPPGVSKSRCKLIKLFFCCAAIVLEALVPAPQVFFPIFFPMMAASSSAKGGRGRLAFAPPTGGEWQAGPAAHLERTHDGRYQAARNLVPTVAELTRAMLLDMPAIAWSESFRNRGCLSFPHRVACCNVMFPRT